MSFEELVLKRNKTIESKYTDALEKVKKVWENLQSSEEKTGKYLFAIADKILFFCELEEEITDSYYKDNSLESLQNTNLQFYDELFPENYKESYANPDHCFKLFGDKMGGAYSAYYISFRNFLTYCFRHEKFEMYRRIEQFLKASELYNSNELEEEKFLEVITHVVRNQNVEDFAAIFTRNYSVDTVLYKQIVQNADLTDIRYLYQYGQNISSNEIETAEFLMTYPQEDIDTLAVAMAKSFIRGFELARKDMSVRKNIAIYYHIGQERIAKALLLDLERRGLNGILSMIFTTSANKQYSYDHRFDGALFIDEEYVTSLTELRTKAASECSDIFGTFAGPIYFDSFGEQPFSPVNKESCLKLSPEQQKLQQRSSIEYSQLMNQYMSRSKTSFCIVGFPLPEIGDDFAEIFAETLAINMMDTEHHEEIQQHIVDALDKAESVNVKGRNGNITDIKVKMQKLEDPAKHTNFVNCGADVNVPVGEVFTSPKLTGTNGILHIKESFLKGLKFTDLKLTFKDGFVEDYSCGNFEKEEDNRKYIEENLLFPHKTLPIGEFAIGTNTRAYVMAKKFDILHVLPVLIVEKMGPHFAIGDTCFTWEEDFAVFNPIDGKEITARDNEKTIARKEDPSKAYTNCHTDITLPYENLDFITAITEDGEQIDIIRDGRFVVPGTEELNKYFTN